MKTRRRVGATSFARISVALTSLALTSLPPCVARASSPQASLEDSPVSPGASSREPTHEGPPTPETVVVDTPLDENGALRVRAGETSVWVEPTLTPEVRDGQPVWVARGRVSRPLASVAAYVPDDRFGTASRLTARRFEVVLDGGHELNTILSGMPIFIQLEVETGVTRSLALALWLEPRLGGLEGTRLVHADRRVQPIAVRDLSNDLRYRARLRAAEDCALELPSEAEGVLSTAGIGAFHLDWTFEVLQASARGSALAIRARCGDRVGMKSARLEVAVARVGLTVGAAEVAFPSPACRPEVWSCLEDARLEGELSACGAYREVASCRNADACAFAPAEPLTLRPAPVPHALEDAVRAFNDGCPSGFSWCRLETVRAFEVGACTDPEATVHTLTEAVATLDALQPRGGLDGEVLDASRLTELKWFGEDMSQGGPALREALLDVVGGDVLTLEIEDEVPCHNCTERRATTFSFSRERRLLIVLDGVIGWDS